MIEKITAMMMMRVPSPIPKTLDEEAVWAFTACKSRRATKNNVFMW